MSTEERGRRNRAQESDQLRVEVALSGGASLGAYEAGALAAIIVGVQRLQRERPGWMVIDGLGGASAGSLVALMGAHVLLEGYDPVDFLHEAWVERLSLDLLRRRRGQGLLSFDHLRSDIRDFLETQSAKARRPARAQEMPIGLHISLTGLQGLTYPIRSLHGRVTFTSTTYADWGRFVFERNRGVGQILEPEGTSALDFVLASASHPGAFTPALLPRGDHEDYYRRHGIDNFPESGVMWYTDGGLVQSQPLCRLLTAAREANARANNGADSFRRALVLIDPRSEDPSGAGQWTDPSKSPKWIEGLRRSLEIVPAQIIYEDALRVEKTNKRLEEARALVEVLAEILGDDADERLRDFITELERDRAEATSSRGSVQNLVGPEANSLQQLVGSAIAEVADLANKEPVDMNVITPRVLAGGNAGEEVPQLLAGDLLADFGGFLDRGVRESDFLLGYASAQEWLGDGLRDTGFDEAALTMMAEEVENRSPGDWRDSNVGSVKVGELPLRARLQLARLGWHAAKALVEDVLHVSGAGPGFLSGLKKAARAARHRLPIAPS
jgi:predicted acylesterase/phospholipase RssA